MADRLSNRAAAKLAGCSHVAIGKAIASGHLPTLPDGSVSPEAVQNWQESRRAPRGGNSRKVTTAKVTKLPDEPVTTLPAPKPVLPGTGGAYADLPDEEAAGVLVLAGGVFATRAEAELHRDSYVARLRQVEYERAAEQVVEVGLVAKEVGAAFAKARTRLLAIPAEQAPRLHRCKTVVELQDALLEVITEALEELTQNGAGDDDAAD